MYSVIYNLSATGHSYEYVGHLMNYINGHPELHGRYMFLLNEGLQEHIGALSYSNAYRISFIRNEGKYPNSIAKSFFEWRLASKVISEAGPFKEIIFLEIDDFLILLTTRLFKKHKLSVKGILFQPYVHLKNKNGLWFLFRHTLRRYAFQKMATTLNPNIKRLFILNDKACPQIMNKHIKDVFQFLPDPIINDIRTVDPFRTEKIMQKYNIQSGRKNLLIFGVIDERKNLPHILRSLQLLPDAVKQKIHVIIAGKFNKTVKEKIQAQIVECRGQISITAFDEFVSEDEREVLFQHCDMVLMPYINYYSSSGILGHSIRHNKTVIVSKLGLTSKIVNEYKMGISVDPFNEEEIRNAILKGINDSDEFRYDGKAIIKEYHPHNFSNILLLN